jgi:hypothetical protein
MRAFFERETFKPGRALTALEDVYQPGSKIIIVENDKAEVTHIRDLARCDKIGPLC